MSETAPTGSNERPLSEALAPSAIVWAAFDAAVKAASPDDWAGHLPNCGYDNELMNDCGCAAYGKRLRAGLAEALTPVVAEYVAGEVENFGVEVHVAMEEAMCGRLNEPGDWQRGARHIRVAVNHVLQSETAR